MSNFGIIHIINYQYNFDDVSRTKRINDTKRQSKINIFQLPEINKIYSPFNEQQTKSSHNSELYSIAVMTFYFVWKS